MLPGWNIPVLTKCLLAGLKQLHLPWRTSQKHLTCCQLKVHVHLQATVCTVIKYSRSCDPWHCNFPVTVFKDVKSHLPGVWITPNFILKLLIIWTQKRSYLCAIQQVLCAAAVHPFIAFAFSEGLQNSVLHLPHSCTLWAQPQVRGIFCRYCKRRFFWPSESIQMCTHSINVDSICWKSLVTNLFEKYWKYTEGSLWVKMPLEIYILDLVLLKC